jgi:hypothetical protein
MAGMAIRAVTFTVRHPVLMGFLGFAASIMIPEEAQLSMVGSGVPIVTQMGAAGQAEVRAFRLIKNDLLMGFIKSHSSLAGKFWYYFGQGFENCVRKYLLNNALGPIPIAGTINSVDAVFNNILIEIKSGGIDESQLAAIVKEAINTGMSFGYVFLYKPANSVVKKIVNAGGSVHYLFED